MVEVDDTTDLEEIAKFDIAGFLLKRGIKTGVLADPVVAETLPNVIVLNTIKKSYVVPTKIEAGQDGKVNFKHSSKIKSFDFEILLKKFLKDERKARLL